MIETQEKIKIETSNVLLQIGIPSNVAGSKYLLKAVQIAVNEPSYVMSVTRRVYPIIAIEFNTKVSNIERAIRHAIDIAWNKNKIIQLNSLFGIEIYSQNDKPTNSEFIALLAERIPFLINKK